MGDAIIYTMDKVIEAHNKGEIDYTAIFDNFNDGLYFPPEATGKQTLTYVDEPFGGDVEDYNGVNHHVFEYSYIHMEPQSYYMSRTEEYMKFLKGYRDASI